MRESSPSEDSGFSSMSRRQNATASADERTEEVKKPVVDDFADMFSKDMSTAVQGEKGDDVDVDSPLKGLWTQSRSLSSVRDRNCSDTGIRQIPKT